MVFFVFNYSWAQVAEVEDKNEVEEAYSFEKSLFLGANFQLGFPQGIFGDNINYTGWGFGGNVLWKLKQDVPVYGGIDFSFQNYDFQAITEITFDLEEYETKTISTALLIDSLYQNTNYFKEVISECTDFKNKNQKHNKIPVIEVKEEIKNYDK